MDYNAYSFIMDFAFMSLLLVIAQFLRGALNFFKTFIFLLQLLRE